MKNKFAEVRRQVYVHKMGRIHYWYHLINNGDTSI